ncbi:hypothetical protein [Methylobacter tundripaludum]|nr:hypothetical protein [Methylobacter tundripaludum]
MKRIGISAALISQGHWRMFDALGEIFGIRFEEPNVANDTGIDAWLYLEINPDSMLRIQNSPLPSYAVISEKHLTSCGESSTINFNKHALIPEILSNRDVRSDEVIKLKGLPHWLQNATTLACKTESPIWAVQEHRDCQHHYVALTIPELNSDEPIFHHFHDNQFLALLPLLTFLRQLTDENRWDPPPLQACFMFDDPNLHWPTYGFINFFEMARHADLHNYHASFATIPLDAWFVHQQTADLFQEHHHRISLLIHGNDHIAEELARKIPNEERTRMLKQALFRIEKLEKRANVSVARVMAPPHGACSEETLKKMALMGYEAACISRGSLAHYNKHANWVRTLGMRPAENIHGLPVLPRFRISMDCQNAILVAALLHQPIIPVGHHQDVAENLNMLAHLSDFINSLGEVRWTNMTSISRNHYSKMIDGDILHLKMYSNIADLLIPEGINYILVERPWWQEGAMEPLLIKTTGGFKDLVPIEFHELIAVHSGQHIQIISSQISQAQGNYDSLYKFEPWSGIRRLMTEARDRLVPELRRLSM